MPPSADQQLRNRNRMLRMKFDQIPANYDAMRPRYVPELFAEVIRYARLDQHMRAVEVGIGTGQATEPFLHTGCQITAVEIGKALAAYTQRKFAGYRNFSVINSSFENAQLDEDACDLFYCASAFHWIPKDIGYTKAFRLLKSGGTFALFFNRPRPVSAEDPTHIAIQEIYAAHGFGKMPAPLTEADSLEIVGDIRAYGFADAHYRLYQNRRTFDSKRYLLLMNTYSDHLAMPEAKRIPFEKEIARAIDQNGGAFTLQDTIDLYLAKKP